jgi:hypothetical protein
MAESRLSGWKIGDARGKLTFGILYQIKRDSEILGTAIKK